MQIKTLDHVNIRTNDLDSMVKWYENTLGFRSGKRPDFSFPGAWLYAGDTAVVHLSLVQGDAGVGSETALKLEHFAFSAEGMEKFEQHLKDMGQAFKCATLPDGRIVQYNVWDPDGNHIHIDFATNE